MALEYRVHVMNVSFEVPTMPDSGQDIEIFGNRLNNLATHGWRIKQVIPIQQEPDLFLVVLERERTEQ
jgi:hypothetical protein